MAWLHRPDAVARRGNLHASLPQAKSVVCVAMHYRTGRPWDGARHGKVARYARGRDYHGFMTRRLRRLLAFIQSRWPCRGRLWVDTGPVLERDLAQRAGLGWIGKNSMLLSRELGSYFLLGELLLDLPLPPDAPLATDHCGTCTRCLDACPTGALVAPRVLDAHRCLSYQTIESHRSIPPGLRAVAGDWIFGCDICQEVCPWNEHSTVLSPEPELWTRDDLPAMGDYLNMPPEEIRARLTGSPLRRPGPRGMKRNALMVLRNRRRLPP